MQTLKLLSEEDEVIERVLRTRYYEPGETTREQLFKRVAVAIMGEDPILWDPIYKLMLHGVFLPNSPTIVNAGRKDHPGTLSACFVLPITDSLTGIDKACVDMGLVHKAFGGTGFNFGEIRPKGSHIKSTGGKSCGPIKVLQLLNAKAHMVGQGGKREGGNMGVLPVNHPDILEWITCKKDLNIDHFNLSVAVDNDFMDKALVESGTCWEKTIFEDICQNAHARGCPGLLFVDRANEKRPSTWPRLKATNPCGEQWLGDYESCNLGSINLSKFVHNRKFFFNDFEDVVSLAIKFLDRVIDYNIYPISEIETNTRRTRNIGLGVMGWADCLILMGIHYDSKEALDLINNIGQALAGAAAYASQALAYDLGPYPLWDKSITEIPQRNYTLTCIAPTGTLSKLAKCSPGIEPIYDWHMEIFTEQGTYKYNYPNMEEVSKHGLEGDTARRIPVEWHIRHQAAWQAWIDNAVSKTINLPAEASLAEVRHAFRLAYTSGCKGITIYRDRSKDSQVLNSDIKGVTPSTAVSRKHSFTCRPGRLYEVESGCGKMFIWIDERDGKQFEVFVVASGGCAANNETTGRVLSDEMQRGVSIADITRPLKKVKCINAMKNPKSQGRSCSDIIGKVIDEDYDIYYSGYVGPVPANPVDHCPQCDAVMIMSGGCSTGLCPACGWSGCS